MAQCTAKSRQTGQQCQRHAQLGQKVCYHHGGKSPQAKRNARLRLFDMVDPALTELARIIARSEDEKVKLSAINSVLDRTGYQRGYEITIDDARDMLIQRLAQLHDERADEDTVDADE